MAAALVLGACAGEERSPAETPAVAVETEVVERTEFAPQLALLGRVEAHEIVPIVVPQRGIIGYPDRFPYGLRTGVDVKRGEPIAFVSNEDARSSLVQTRLQAQSARQNLERLTRGHQAGITTAADLDRARLEAEIAQERLESAERLAARLSITAPRSGALVVDARWPPGSDVPAQTELARIAAGSEPRIVARAGARQRARLNRGQTASIVEPSTGRELGSGVVDEIAAVIDQSGTAEVIIQTAGGQDLPSPGEGVVVRIDLDRRRSMTIPERAVVYAGDGTSAFVVENDRARRRSIRLGERAEGRIEVLEGLEPGDRVVVSGAAFLQDDQPVVEQSPAGPEQG